MTDRLNVTFDLRFLPETAERLTGANISLPGLLPVDGLTPSSGDLIDLDVDGQQVPFQVRTRHFRWLDPAHLVLQLTMKLPDEVQLSTDGATSARRDTAQH
ncbi:hypothetical protein [Xanthomonas translucens]|uniref:Uncharacterized protein n=2 Tax=Xanthomonas campestris pv. translucens TaxID=343 RepID=A0A120EZ77_XANCT|nr:hypothetical protein [Xanthomonas translucens]KWV17122.1 hypothetical protein ATB53_00120 [Xanthomonas translucens]QSQ34723.1 hypothetical protein ISN31_03605 [Xanthomonas translucens pv. translucens]